MRPTDLTARQSLNVTVEECVWMSQGVSHPQMTSHPHRKAAGFEVHQRGAVVLATRVKT